MEIFDIHHHLGSLTGGSLQEEPGWQEGPALLGVCAARPSARRTDARITARARRAARR